MTVKQREYRVTIIAKHGYIPSQRSRHRDGPLSNAACEVCKAKIKGSHAGTAADGRILCKTHRDEARAQARKRRTKLSRAAHGTVGHIRWTSGQCRTCGNWYLSNNPTSVSCSDECVVINRTEARKAAQHRRRARERNAFVANVRPADVFKADSYRCHICKKKTNPNRVVPHPRAPTIDHLIPLAKGGTHEPMNCRTACFRCNSLKRDQGGGEQFAICLL
jgi:5-methylcytosine-specific restriction endonuclease McrA